MMAISLLGNDVYCLEWGAAFECRPRHCVIASTHKRTRARAHAHPHTHTHTRTQILRRHEEAVLLTYSHFKFDYLTLSYFNLPCRSESSPILLASSYFNLIILPIRRRYLTSLTGSCFNQCFTKRDLVSASLIYHTWSSFSFTDLPHVNLFQLPCFTIRDLSGTCCR